MPRLSIITPVRNAAAWLADCVRSVQSQSFTDWEWIIIDDHSQDGTRVLLKEIASLDPRINCFTSEGYGIIPALQQALKLSKGKYITRMDADDLMPKDRLQIMATHLNTAPSNTVVTGHTKYFSDNTVSQGYLKYERWLNENLASGKAWQNIYRECVIASPNWMVRRSELLAIGGFDALEYPEDYDLCFRWYEYNFKIHYTHQLTLLWREHPLRTSRRSNHYSQQAFFQLKLERFLQLDYEPTKKLCLWGAGTKAQLSSRILRANKVDFMRMALKEADSQSNILSFEEIKNLKEVQILIAVYPPDKERTQINEYLENLRLFEGTDYWYL